MTLLDCLRQSNAGAEQSQDAAVGVALRRGQFELSCATAVPVLLSSTIAPARGLAGARSAPSTPSAWRGAGKKASYIVVCPDPPWVALPRPRRPTAPSRTGKVSSGGRLCRQPVRRTPVEHCRGASQRVDHEAISSPRPCCSVSSSAIRASPGDSARHLAALSPPFPRARRRRRRRPQRSWKEQVRLRSRRHGFKNARSPPPPQKKFGLRGAIRARDLRGVRRTP